MIDRNKLSADIHELYKEIGYTDANAGAKLDAFWNSFRKNEEKYLAETLVTRDNFNNPQADWYVR